MPKPSYEIPSNPPATDRKFRPEDEKTLEAEKREFVQSEEDKMAPERDKKGDQSKDVGE